MRFSLPSIKCSATAEQFRCLNCAQRYDYRALGGNRKEPPNIWLTVAKYAFVGWALNFRVRLLLKGAVTSDQVLKIYILLPRKKGNILRTMKRNRTDHVCFSFFNPLKVTGELEIESLGCIHGANSVGAKPATIVNGLQQK